jgi:hypothetical protein
MRFSLGAGQIHERIVNGGTAGGWIKAAGAASKRGKFGGWFADPQLKLDFPALINKLKNELGGQFPNATDSDWREVADWLFGAVPR